MAAASELLISVSPLGGPVSAAGTLPPWFLRAVAAGSALVALAILLATGNFSIFLWFVITAVIALPTAYIWSRIGGGASTGEGSPDDPFDCRQPSR